MRIYADEIYPEISVGGQICSVRGEQDEGKQYA